MYIFSKYPSDVWLQHSQGHNNWIRVFLTKEGTDTVYLLGLLIKQNSAFPQQGFAEKHEVHIWKSICPVKIKNKWSGKGEMERDKLDTTNMGERLQICLGCWSNRNRRETKKVTMLWKEKNADRNETKILIYVFSRKFLGTFIFPFRRNISQKVPKVTKIGCP